MATFEHKDMVLDSESLADACFCLRHFGYLPPEFDHEVVENPLIVAFVETYNGYVGVEDFQEWEEVFDRGMAQLKIDLGLVVPNRVETAPGIVKEADEEEGYW